MPYSSLADLVEELERDGELVRVRAEVDPELELAEIASRVSREAGPALVFERVRGSRLPVLANLLAQPARIARAMGVDSIDEIGRRLTASGASVDSSTVGGRTPWLRRLFNGAAATGTANDPSEPKLVKTALCQQVVRLASDVDLTELPAPRAWPAESCRSIRGGLVHTSSPENERRAVEEAPLAILDARRLAVLWTPHERAHAHFEEHRQRGTTMPVAISLGGDPLVSLSAMAPWSRDVDLYRWAGLWRERPAELVRGRTQDVRVPADAELVIEGVVDPAADAAPPMTLVAPTGYCHTFDAAAVMQVTAITHRANPLFPLVVVGPPPHELSWRASAIERLTLPLVQSVAPEVVDLALIDFGGASCVAAVSIQKSYAGQAQKVAAAIWGLAPALAIKLLVIVDAAVDPHDAREVAHRVAAHTAPERDFFFGTGPASVMDHAALRLGLGSMAAIDATEKLPGEHPRPWPAIAASDEAMAERVAARWREYGLGQLPSGNP